MLPYAIGNRAQVAVYPIPPDQRLACHAPTVLLGRTSARALAIASTVT